MAQFVAQTGFWSGQGPVALKGMSQVTECRCPTMVPSATTSSRRRMCFDLAWLIGSWARLIAPELSMRSSVGLGGGKPNSAEVKRLASNDASQSPSVMGPSVGAELRFYSTRPRQGSRH
eukprot:1479523-Pleurochrysis_carterae.AAC.1